MGGRGSSSATSKVGSTNAQQPTKAKSIENMNEAQLRQEIEKTENRLQRQKAKYGEYIGDTEFGKRIAESFPMGVGIATGRNRTNIERDISRSVDRAVKATEIHKDIESNESRLKELNKALQQVAGTGKTISQIRQEAERKLVSATPTMKWTRSTEENMNKYTVYSSGEYMIRYMEGTAFIYKGNEQLGHMQGLAKAKAYVERLNKQS